MTNKKETPKLRQSCLAVQPPKAFVILVLSFLTSSDSCPMFLEGIMVARASSFVLPTCPKHSPAI